MLLVILYVERMTAKIQRNQETKLNDRLYTVLHNEPESTNMSPEKIEMKLMFAFVMSQLRNMRKQLDEVEREVAKEEEKNENNEKWLEKIRRRGHGIILRVK